MTDKPTPEQIQRAGGMTRDEAMERILDMIGDAYASGAVDVHSAWVADLGQSEPDFGEATSDYKASVAEAAATVIQQAFAERDGRLADHVAVHRAMLQGHIAKPSPANIWHLYQRDLLDAMPDEFKAERDGEIERLQMALRDMADAVAVYSQQPVEATRQRPRIHQDQWEQITMICGDMLRQALAAKGDSRG